MNNKELDLIRSYNEKNNKNVNHLELFYNNNKNTTNTNQKNIILRGDYFYSFYNYAKNSFLFKNIGNSIENYKKNISSN